MAIKIPSSTKHLGTLHGPLLLFGGAYSNLEALEALKEEADRRNISAQNVICTGDTVGYCSDPQPCLDLLEDWGAHAIAGNVETNLANGTDDCGCGFGDGSRCDMFSRLWYTYATQHVTERGLKFMASLPDILIFEYAARKLPYCTVAPGINRSSSGNLPLRKPKQIFARTQGQTL